MQLALIYDTTQEMHNFYKLYSVYRYEQRYSKVGT